MRIVSLWPSISDTISKLGLEDSIIGVTPYCLKYLKLKHRVVGSCLEVDSPKLSNLKPDIVLLEGRLQKGIAEKLMREGYSVYLIPFPRSIFGILENIILIGSILGRLTEARRLAYEILNELIGLKRRELAGSIYVELWLGDDIVTCGSLTYIDDMLSWIGLQNIFSDVASEFFKPNFNHVKIRNPHLIVVNYEPYPKHRERISNILEIFKERGWEDMEAIKRRKVILIEESSTVNLAHHGPSTITGTLRYLLSRS